MKKKLLFILITLLITVMVALLLTACSGGETNNSEDVDKTIIKTEFGEVEGYSENGITVFKGIPIAKPPVGDLRFAPAQDPDPWNEVLSCKESKPSAIQKINEDDNLEYSEDCLYLNIWAPDNIGSFEDAPVLVYIHGGAYATGSPNNPLYDGTRFAQEGVIQVNIPYRLNALGFTAFEESESEYGYLGNIGLLDQIHGLKWVKENIANFGGDPDNITVSGESAGSMSVSNLILCDEAEGLFNKAIMESGNLLGQPAISNKTGGDKQQAIDMTNSLMEKLKVSDMEEARELDAQTLADNSIFSIDITNESDHFFFPVFDGKLLPENPYEAVLERKMNKVDILAGYNSDEGSMFVPEGLTEEKYVGFVESIFDIDADKVLERYSVDNENSPTQRARQIFADGLVGGNQYFAEALTDLGNKAYLYNFDYTTEELEEEGMGVMHALELGFVFDTFSEEYKTDEIKVIIEEVHNRWLGFIKNGDPNSEIDSDIKWPEYDSNQKQIIKFNAESTITELPMYENGKFMIETIWE